MSSTCKQCEGTGYEKFSDDNCPSCGGRGYVEFWETKQYQQTGKAPRGNTADVDKGYATLGLVGGVIVGFGAYVITHERSIAIAAGLITAFLAMTVLRLFFKYLIPILVASYLLYLLFG